MQNEKTIKQEIITTIIPLITASSGFLLLYMVFPTNIWLLITGGVFGGLAGYIICIALGYITHKQVLSDTKKSVRSLVLTTLGLILGLVGTWLWWFFFGSQW